MQRGPWWLNPLFAAILAVLSACTVGGEVSGPGETVTTSGPATVESEPSATVGPLPTVQVHTTIQPTPQATETAITALPTLIVESEPLATVAMALNDLSLEADDISIFPVPAVYAGDRVSIQIAPNVPGGLAPNDVDVRVLIDGKEMVTGNLNWRKFSGDSVGIYEWVWDTINQTGEHTITATLDPQDLIQIGDENPANNQATITVAVEPREALPEAEANATWVEGNSECCNVHVVSGTAAHRDLGQLLPRVDAAFERAADVLDEPLIVPYEVFLIDRVIGQGGYAAEAMVVSYLDRNYAGGGLDEVLTHEAVHLIDQQFAPDRITFLSEGVAVWATGGHYQQEDLGQRMAALVELGLFIPLAEVIDNFYATQHEISYLEAASLISYLVETYGWSAVRPFYTNATADDGGTQSQAIDENLRIYFNSNLQQVEADWLDYLSGLPRDRSALTDLQATVLLYDVMRRYQTLYDPTAYYLYAWLPSPDVAVQLDATADFSRHPESAINMALESMLKAANDALWRGDYERVNALILSVSRVINNDGQFLDPLAKSYLDIVRTVIESGYEVQQITLTGNRAEALVTRPGKMFVSQLHLVLNSDKEWRLTP